MTRFFILLLLLCTTYFAQAQLSPITKVTLEFTPTDGAVVTASATDTGNGLMLDNPINLMESTDYTLAIKLNNGDTDITSEITNNANDFQFFFETTEDQFEGAVQYADADGNGLPIGLVTNWTTSCVEEVNLSGNFRIWLGLFAGTKTANSTISDGTNVFDLNWLVNIANDADAPECENEEEVIDKVTLTFTPVDGGTTIVAVAADPDGPGPQDLVVEDISLAQNKTYGMSITLENTIEGEDITEEIREEDEDHLFLFGWTGDIFTDPMGDGNIDNRVDVVNYNDQDSNGLPVGLSTNWTVGADGSSGTLRIVLKHQPEMKSADSNFEDGGTDIDITWNVNAILTSTDNLNSDQKLVITPNPVQQEIRLLTENLDLQNSKIAIFNTLGIVVKTLRTSENILPVQNLETGHYILSIQGDNWNAVRRFVKVN